MIVEVIPFKTFKHRIQLMKKIQDTQKAKIEIYSTYLYVETKGERLC